MTEDEKAMLRRENEEVLLNLGYKPGVELARRRVNFSLVFLTEHDRSAAMDGVVGLGFDCEISDEPATEGTFEAVATRVLSPTGRSISDCEVMLSEFLATFGAKVDGWGFFGDTVH